MSSDDADAVDEPSARYEELKIRLPEPVHGLEEVSAVLGIPEWWPTGDRIALALAHGSTGDLNDPVLEYLQRRMTEERLLTLRFNFPFAEAGKRATADSDAVLERAFLGALSLLGRDPTAAPAHIFVGGKGLGARVAAMVATTLVRVDGVFFAGFPLHAQDKPEQLRAEQLYRITSPMLFMQGTRDRTCDLDALKRALGRVGAPTRLKIVEEADQNFRVLKKSARTDEEALAELGDALADWTADILD